jgi:hypothetical protein
MNTMREKWTDDRLDDLNHRVDLGFDRVDRRFDQVDKRFDRVDARFDLLESRFDTMQRTMVQAVIALTGAMLAGWAALTALIATQL